MRGTPQWANALKEAPVAVWCLRFEELVSQSHLESYLTGEPDMNGQLDLHWGTPKPR
jgi:hypothetical protein